MKPGNYFGKLLISPDYLYDANDDQAKNNLERTILKLNKEEIYVLLDSYHITYESYEHDAAYTIEDLDKMNIPHKEWIVKNLFLRDDKKRNYYLVTVPGYKTINLKKLSEKIPSRKLSFANEESLFELLALKKGHVTPFGILNNTQKNVIVVFDSVLQGQKIGIHPMENTATVFLDFENVIKLIEEYGNPVVMCDID
ncbi:MAG TPA: prolyl-tRNA synthetase associated domain-containing protein [Oscillospiraceae bacterium]|nr:prolyl-tRNA synthetase associated domain-containing protein [Oscillospiraceae bacterium]